MLKRITFIAICMIMLTSCSNEKKQASSGSSKNMAYESLPISSQDTNRFVANDEQKGDTSDKAKTTKKSSASIDSSAPDQDKAPENASPTEELNEAIKESVTDSKDTDTSDKMSNKDTARATASAPKTTMSPDSTTRETYTDPNGNTYTLGPYELPDDWL